MAHHMIFKSTMCMNVLQGLVVVILEDLHHRRDWDEEDFQSLAKNRLRQCFLGPGFYCSFSDVLPL